MKKYLKKNDFLHNDNIEGLEKYLDKISKYSTNSLLLPIGADHLGMLKNAQTAKRLKNFSLFLLCFFKICVIL